jgi:hypothetical protein
VTTRPRTLAAHLRGRWPLAALVAALLLLGRPPIVDGQEAVDLFDPSIDACSSAPDTAWYYQANAGSDERCQISDIREPLVDAVWSCTSGDCSALTAAAGDTLDAGSADSAVPWKVATTAAPTTEGAAIWDSDDNLLAVGDGSGTQRFSPRVSYVLDSKTSSTTISNTVTETAIYSYTIPGGTLGASDALSLTLLSEFLNNSGTTRGFTIRVKFGGSTVIDFSTGNNFGSSATRRVGSIEILVNARGSTSAQMVTLSASVPVLTPVFGTVNTGTGTTMSTADNTLRLHSGALSVDTTSNQTLEVTIELSTNLSTLEWVCYAGTLEHLVKR